MQEEELEALWNQMELQNHLKKKKNWDAWMDGEVEAQIEEEIQEYLAASSDPTVYLNRKASESLEPDAKVQTETTSGERIQTGIAGMESRRAEGICWWRKESGFHGRAGLFAAKRNTKRHKIRDTVTWDLEARKGKHKGLRGGETNRSPETQFPRCQADTFKKPEKRVAEGVQSAASSVASSASTVTPATLAARTAKKTAHTFKNYVQEVNQAAQQAIGEEWAKLEDTKQQNAQVGDLPSFVKYLGATIGSVVLAGAAMVLQLAAVLLTVLVTMLAFLLGSGIGNFFDCRCDVSLIGGFLDQQPATGHGFASFRNRGYDGSFFCRTGRERDPGIHGSGTADCRIRIRVIWARW